MTLTDKARGLHKQAILGAAVAALGQNAIGIPIARSTRLKGSIAKSLMTGVAGRKSPRTIKSLASDAIAGVVAPEVNASKNQAYSLGEKIRSKLNIGNMSKRDQVVARLAAAGDTKGLARVGQTDSKLAKSVAKIKNKNSIPDMPKSIQKYVGSNIKMHPPGSRKPSSDIAALAGNAAILPVPGGLSTAAVNVSKMGLSSNAASKNKIVQHLNKKFVTDPMRHSAKAGLSGKAYDTKAHWRSSVLMNPFTSEANRMAHAAGSKSNKR